ncbi:MAG: methyltetrahydrofolate cobalamin methyltransferase [Eubacteriales bacterium]
MIIIGEKINGAIPSVAKAITERNAEVIRNLAIAQVNAGSTFIDVCASVDDSIEMETMEWLLNIVQDTVDTPIAVDSPNTRTCVKCMTLCKKPGLLNSVSLEGTKIDDAFPALAKAKDWEVIALLNDDTGIPKTAEKRLEVFENIMKKAKEFGIDPSRFHIDPLVEMLCTSEDGIKMVVHVITEIKKQYSTVHITGAVSNISFNLPVRKLVNQGFVVLAMNAGMDSAILDPLNRDMMGMIYATEALLGSDDYCMEYIGAYRNGIFGTIRK